MRFLSVCSGIEAASVAWNPLGWKAVAFSEIEPFPCAVLAHHYPDVPNLGDMTRFREWPDYAIDLLCGGTPCQSFSVAGLRKGLDDPRGNLMLTFGAIAARYCPRWLVWENVPGVLSSNGGRDFGTFLGMLGQLGYGFAYRVLDAQYFGLAQRRKRVFVVGCLGDWRSAAAVLFERKSLSGHLAPSRKAREGISAGTLRGTDGGSDVDHARAGHLQVFGGNRTSGPRDVASALSAHGGTGRHDFETETFVMHGLCDKGFDASGDPNAASPVSFHGSQDPNVSGDVTHPIGRNQGREACMQHGRQVRRLTPLECERLMGFPDDYTLIKYGRNRAKDFREWMDYLRLRRRGLTEAEARQLAADGPRYKALGNSWAVPVARWIGERINEVEQIKHKSKAA